MKSPKLLWIFLPASRIRVIFVSKDPRLKEREQHMLIRVLKLASRIVGVRCSLGTTCFNANALFLIYGLVLLKLFEPPQHRYRGLSDSLRLQNIRHKDSVI